MSRQLLAKSTLVGAAAMASSSPAASSSSVPKTCLTTSGRSAATSTAAFVSSAPEQPASSSSSSLSTPSSLAKARQLKLPSTQEMLRRDQKVYDFWNQNEDVLEKAWKEWNEHDKVALSLPKLDASLINPELRAAIEAAWKADSTTPASHQEQEEVIKKLWKEVAPGVYVLQFFDLEQTHKLRQWLDAAATDASGIPVRPPHGITLNRKGAMIDPRSVGHLAAPDLQAFYRMLVEDYVRPLGRLFFPSHIRETDDAETFAFSIQYQGEQGGDKSIRHHTDASTLTFNINLDASESWTGSSLLFVSPDNGNGNNVKQNQVFWEPGIAVMHLGKTMHAALPIESGTRSNLVIWTMPSSGTGGIYGGSSSNPLSGTDGKYPEEYQLSSEERWTKHEKSEGPYYDRWSPF